MKAAEYTAGLGHELKSRVALRATSGQAGIPGPQRERGQRATRGSARRGEPRRDRARLRGGEGARRRGSARGPREAHTGSRDASGAGRADDHAGRGDVARRPQRGADSGPFFPFCFFPSPLFSFSGFGPLLFPSPPSFPSPLPLPRPAPLPPRPGPGETPSEESPPPEARRRRRPSGPSRSRAAVGPGGGRTPGALPALAPVRCIARGDPVLPQCLSAVSLIQFLRSRLDGGASTISVLEIRLNLFLK